MEGEKEGERRERVGRSKRRRMYTKVCNASVDFFVVSELINENNQLTTIKVRQLKYHWFENHKSEFLKTKIRSKLSDITQHACKR